MVKGAEITLMTLGLCLSMTTDFVVAPQGVGSHSFVAIADGHATVECSRQQWVSIVLGVKPGNCGKRNSQIVLIAFLQKVMFDDRTTTFEHECFNPVWREVGVSPNQY